MHMRKRIVLIPLFASSLFSTTAANARAPQRGASGMVAAGSTHSCVLLARGVVQCWGAEAPAGAGTRISRGVAPTIVTTLTGVKSLSARFGQTCAVRFDGTVHCWGGGGRPAAVPGL